MKMLWKWLIPVLFVILGIFLYTTVHGHSFLGLVSFALAALISCYYLIAMLRAGAPMTAKVLNTFLTACLILGLIAFGITESIIVRASAGDPDRDHQYIVVLGAKVNGTSPSLSLNDRIGAAYAYLKAHPDTVAVLSGGQGPDEGISEAQCMFNELTARGIPARRLWLEDRSTSTWENLNLSLDLIEEKTGTRPETIGLVSSEYHLYRAGLFARDCGVTAVGIPAKTSWLTIRINYFMREVGGIWHYLVLGGQYHD